MAHITRAIELGTKYSGTTHYRVDDGWHTQSILKRNYHWRKAQALSLTFGHSQTVV